MAEIVGLGTSNNSIDGYNLADVDNLQVMSLVWQSDTMYQYRVPKPTRDNLSQINDMVINDQDLYSRYAAALTQKVAASFMRQMDWYNPLSMFKKGTVEYGAFVEDIFVDIARAFPYSPEVSEDMWMKRVKPNIASVFHKINREDFYKVTIEREQIRRAFQTETGVVGLIEYIIASLGKGNQVDEYLLMKRILVEAANGGAFTNVYLGADFAGGITEDNAHTFVTKLKAMSDSLLFPAIGYNSMGVMNNTPKSKQILFIDPEVNAINDVSVLSSAFHQNDARFMGRIVLVDTLKEITGCYALLVDEDFFQVYDVLNIATSAENGEGLYTQHWLHVWQILSYSPFANAIMFTNTEPEVTGVTVTGAATGVKKSVVQFTANVAITGGFDNKGVIWSIAGSGEGALRSVINPNGELMIGLLEPNASIIVTATSIADDTKTGTATITIS